jgi:hypothetical protein
MNDNVTPISPISSVGSLSASEQIELLREQMLRYTQFAQANPPGSTDYRALEYAISTQNVSDAQAALERLQLDSESAGGISSFAADISSLASNASQSESVPDQVTKEGSIDAQA